MGFVDPLFSAYPRKLDLSLARIQGLLSRMGHPEKDLPPTIHVAGTNGKGSVLAYCRSALEHAGKQVHVFTSPHLVQVRERVVLGAPGGGSCVSEDAWASAIGFCEACRGAAEVSSFELITAAAFFLFARNRADFLLLETGLGGRFDATNVIESPVLTILTSISYDHMDFLGKDLATIARAKAGILKAGVPCVVSRQDEEILEEIREQAARLGSPLWISGKDWSADVCGDRLVYRDAGGSLEVPLPCLVGVHQIENAGTALCALRHLPEFVLEEETAEAAMRRAYWPGRLQRLHAGEGPGAIRSDWEIWLDGGHNPSAGRVVAESMRHLADRSHCPLILIVGMMSSKDCQGFLLPFLGVARQILCVPIPDQQNSFSAQDLASCAEKLGFSASVASGVPEALEQWNLQNPKVEEEDAEEEPQVRVRFLICGSLYLVGSVLSDRGMSGAFQEMRREELPV